MKNKLIHNFLLCIFILLFILQTASVFEYFSPKVQVFFDNSPNKVIIEDLTNQVGGPILLEKGDAVVELANTMIDSATQMEEVINTNKGQIVKVKLERNESIVETNISIPNNYPFEKIGIIYTDSQRDNYPANSLFFAHLKTKFIIFEIFLIGKVILFVGVIVLLLRSKKIGFYLATGYLIIAIIALLFKIFI